VNIGQNVKRIREEQRYTQTEIARRCGVTPAAISAIEHGDFTPSTALLVKLAKALSVPVEMLLKETEEPASSEKAEASRGAERNDVKIRREGSHITVEAVSSASATDEIQHKLASIVNERFDAIVADLRAERFGDDVIREIQSMRSRVLELVAGR
jgi:putative transcriptional regulator